MNSRLVCVVFLLMSFSQMSHSEINMLVDRFEVDKTSIESQLRKAVVALQKYAEKKQEATAAETGTKDLLPEPETVRLTLSLNRVPMKKDYRFREIRVPHPIVNIESKSLCFLAKDPKESAVADIKAANLPFEKIIAVKSLKRKYVSIEDRKDLANRFDLFFCDANVFELMGKLLGKYFFETKKAKIPTPLFARTQECFERALSTARFRVRGGSVVGIRIGDRSMDAEKLVENAMAVVEYMATKYCTHERTRNNVFNIALGATNLVDLPIWSVPVAIRKEKTEVPVTVETPKNKKESKPQAKPVEPVAPADIATVPVKKLKQVQKQRVEKAKAELTVENPKKKQKK